MPRRHPTVADVRANKGKHQYTMIQVECCEELPAMSRATPRDMPISMLSVPASETCGAPPLRPSPRMSSLVLARLPLNWWQHSPPRWKNSAVLWRPSRSNVQQENDR